MFSFFEANVPGIVPNEFENPFKIMKNRFLHLVDQYEITEKIFYRNNPSRISINNVSNDNVNMMNTSTESESKKEQ